MNTGIARVAVSQVRTSVVNLSASASPWPHMTESPKARKRSGPECSRTAAPGAETAVFPVGCATELVTWYVYQPGPGSVSVRARELADPMVTPLRLTMNPACQFGGAGQLK